MSYRHLNARERMTIFYLHQMGLTQREIGRRLNRSHSTISRELTRNKRAHGMCYCDRAAQSYAEQRKAKARHQRRYQNVGLRDYVLDRLRQGWSPEIIANRLKIEYPRRKHMQISTETIYQWIYNDAAAGGNLYQYLPCSHPKRKKQRRYTGCRAHIPDRVDIDKRPKVVEQRKRYGDWEGDTMVGARHQGRLVTHVERKSRYLLAGRIKDGTSEAFNALSSRLFNAIPEQWRKTLTLDNGSENAAWKVLADTLKFDVFFAKPYASWERGTNENTNGLIRRYFPKGTDFLKISEQELDSVIEQLNNRPRKCLKFRTPFEVFNKVTGGALGT